MSKKLHSILLFLFLSGLCAACTESESRLSDLERQLDQLISDSTQINPNNRNAVFLLDMPQHSFTYRGASGRGSVAMNTPMTPKHQFYIESITKTFTATLVLQLMEEGLLGRNGLEATLGELEIFPPEVLGQLHCIDGQSYGSGITVSQLVHHRTGMKNFTYDDENGKVSDYPNMSFAPNSLLGLFVTDPVKGLAGLMACTQKHLPEGVDLREQIINQGFPEECDLNSYYFFSSPYKHWDYDAWKNDPNDRLAGLLNFYLSGMNQTATFAPGEDFAYTDTNYLILGLLIEKITGNSLHQELRTRIFDPLGMDHSYLSYSSVPPIDKYQKDLSELWALGLPIVNLGVNRSMMWSDAGIVSTVDDLNTFIRALSAGELFKNKTTLETMLKVPEGVAMGYGCGIGVTRTDTDTILFHTGGAASWMIYFTKADISFIGTMNDAAETGNQRLGDLHKGVYEVLGKYGININSPF